jgi:hypothetical protein
LGEPAYGRPGAIRYAHGARKRSPPMRVPPPLAVPLRPDRPTIVAAKGYPSISKPRSGPGTYRCPEPCPADGGYSRLPPPEVTPCHRPLCLTRPAGRMWSRALVARVGLSLNDAYSIASPRASRMSGSPNFCRPSAASLRAVRKNRLPRSPPPAAASRSLTRSSINDECLSSSREGDDNVH